MTQTHSPTAGRLQPLLPSDPDRLGSWHLLARLGSGGMGTVYLARSPRGRTAALKAVHRSHAARPEAKARFRQEVRAMRDLQRSAPDSRRFAAVIDADTEGPQPWLATEYVPAPTLAQMVDTHGPWPEPALWPLGAELAQSLATVHRTGLVHRDVKPSNVLTASDGPRLIDFGITLFLDDERLTRTGELLGSPGYLAPEQAEGHPAAPPCDVFALGAVLVFAATGAGPHGTGRPEDLLFRARHEAPRLDGIGDDALRSLLARCLSSAPEDRPTAAELYREMSAGPQPATFTDCLPPSVLTDIALRTTRDAVLPVALRDDAMAAAARTTARHRGSSRRHLLLGAGAALAVSGSAAASYAAGRITRGTAGSAADQASADAPQQPPGVGDGGAAPSPLWTYRGQLGDWGTLVVANDTLVTTPSGAGSEMVGLDIADGSVRWTLSGVHGRQPVVTSDGETILMRGVQDTGQDGLDLIDARTGRTSHSGDLGIRLNFMNHTPVAATAGEMAYVAGHDQSATTKDEVRELPQSIAAYDMAAGEVRWRATVPLISEGWVEGVVAGGCFILLGWDVVHAFDVTDGSVIWERELGEGLADVLPGSRTFRQPPDRRIVVAPDNSVLITGRGLLRLDASTGESLWSLVPDDDPDLREAAKEFGYGDIARYGAPAIVGNTAYLNQMGTVHAIDLTTYDSQWNWMPQADSERMQPPPYGILSTSGLVFPPVFGELALLALDAESGEVRWELAEAGGYAGEVLTAVDEERIYVQAGDTVRALPLAG